VLIHVLRTPVDQELPLNPLPPIDQEYLRVSYILRHYHLFLYNPQSLQCT
jgi:hypothetical protein